MQSSSSKESLGYTDFFNPPAKLKLKKSVWFVESRVLEASFTGTNRGIVKERDAVSGRAQEFTVDFIQRTCSCGRYDQDGVMDRHAYRRFQMDKLRISGLEYTGVYDDTLFDQVALAKWWKKAVRESSSFGQIRCVNDDLIFQIQQELYAGIEMSQIPIFDRRQDSTSSMLQSRQRRAGENPGKAVLARTRANDVCVKCEYCEKTVHVTSMTKHVQSSRWLLRRVCRKTVQAWWW